MIRANWDGMVEGMWALIRRREDLFVKQYREAVTEVLRMLAETSPQWSGLFAASWRVRSVQASGRVSSAFDSSFADEATEDQFKYSGAGGPAAFSTSEPKFMGDEEAVDWCLQINKPYIQRLTLRSRPEFYNTVSYAQYVMANNSQGDPNTEPAKQRVDYLRPGNYVLPLPIPLGYVKQSFPDIVANIE